MAQCRLFPTPLREGVFVFFFFYLLLDVADLEKQLAAVSSHIPNRDEIRKLVLATANSEG